MSPPPKILIAEDDRFLTRAYQAKLSAVGFEVQTAGDGEEALKMLAESKPNMLLLDLMLPKKSGFEVLEAMKKDAALKSIPVLILSNLGQDQDIQRGKDLGAIDYLVKTNVKLDAVVQKIKQYLPQK